MSHRKIYIRKFPQNSNNNNRMRLPFNRVQNSLIVGNDNERVGLRTQSSQSDAYYVGGRVSESSSNQHNIRNILHYDTEDCQCDEDSEQGDLNVRKTRPYQETDSDSFVSSETLDETLHDVEKRRSVALSELKLKKTNVSAPSKPSLITRPKKSTKKPKLAPKQSARKQKSARKQQSGGKECKKKTSCCPLQSWFEERKSLILNFEDDPEAVRALPYHIIVLSSDKKLLFDSYDIDYPNYQHDINLSDVKCKGCVFKKTQVYTASCNKKTIEKKSLKFKTGFYVRGGGEDDSENPCDACSVIDSYYVLIYNDCPTDLRYLAWERFVNYKVGIESHDAEFIATQFAKNGTFASQDGNVIFLEKIQEVFAKYFDSEEEDGQEIGIHTFTFDASTRYGSIEWTWSASIPNENGESSEPSYQQDVAVVFQVNFRGEIRYMREYLNPYQEKSNFFNPSLLKDSVPCECY